MCDHNTSVYFIVIVLASLILLLTHTHIIYLTLIIFFMLSIVLDSLYNYLGTKSHKMNVITYWIRNLKSVATLSKLVVLWILLSSNAVNHRFKIFW